MAEVEVEVDNAAIGEEVVRLQGELLQRDAALEAVQGECDKAIALAESRVEAARAEAQATRDLLAVANTRLEEVPALRLSRDLRRQVGRCDIRAALL
ncbi:hypothetical protein [Cupriavidus necator]